jgi:alpha-ketoglutarate-dependent taurine dioxygenase
MPATQTTLRIDKIKDHIGAEANGIDLRQPLDAATFRRLHDALIDNVALVIRDQKFTAAQFQDAAALFGELMEDQNRLYLAPGWKTGSGASVLARRRAWCRYPAPPT